MEIHCAYDQLVQVSDLKPQPKNPNTHSAAQVAAIAGVIDGNGWRAPINRLGLHKAILSAQAAEARRKFGIHNRGQGARLEFRQGSQRKAEEQHGRPVG